MGIARNGEVELYYERLNEGGDGPVIIVNGLSVQVGGFGWPPEFCQLLTEAGLEVILLENRDAGLSTELTEAGPVDLEAVLGGAEVPIPYTVHDMADDAIAVLDELGVEKAHFVGQSMGGFISRWAAIDHPSRVASLTLHITGAGAPEAEGPQLPEDAVGRFLEFAQPREREQALANSLEMMQWLWGPEIPLPSQEEMEEQAALAYDRAYRPHGVQRQLLATLATPGLLAAQSQIRCPTLVVQGSADPCFPIEHGESIAASIDGAEYWLVEGMGHSLPPQVFEPLAERIAQQVRTPAAA